MVGLLGQRDELLRLVEDAFGDVHDPRARQRDHHRRRGAPSGSARLFEELVVLLEAGPRASTRRDVGRTIDMVKADERPSEVLTTEVLRRRGRKPSGPRRRARSATSTPSPPTSITFAHRPGRHRQVATWPWRSPCRPSRPSRSTASSSPARRSRPASGSGSCPATCMAKVDPYLRPLYDALYDMLEPEGDQRLMDRGTIEVAPLGLHARAHPERLASSSSTRRRTRRPSR